MCYQEYVDFTASRPALALALPNPLALALPDPEPDPDPDPFAKLSLKNALPPIAPFESTLGNVNLLENISETRLKLIVFLLLPIVST